MTHISEGLRIFVQNWVDESNCALALRETLLVDQVDDRGEDGCRSTSATDEGWLTVGVEKDVETNSSHIRVCTARSIEVRVSVGCQVIWGRCLFEVVRNCGLLVIWGRPVVTEATSGVITILCLRDGGFGLIARVDLQKLGKILGQILKCRKGIIYLSSTNRCNPWARRRETRGESAWVAVVFRSSWNKTLAAVANSRIS